MCYSPPRSIIKVSIYDNNGQSMTHSIEERAFSNRVEANNWIDQLMEQNDYFAIIDEVIEDFEVSCNN